MRLIEFFDIGVEIAPDRPFLVEGGLVRTHRQSQVMSHRVAVALHRSGIEPGAKAAVYSPNSALAFECVLGVLRAECVWVTINVRNSIEDNAYVLDLCDVDVLFFHSSVAAQTHALVKASERSPLLVCIDAVDPAAENFDTWVAPPGSMAAPLVGDRDTVAALMPTGGTTGRSKAVQVTNLNWEVAIACLAVSLGMPDISMLIAAPMTHAAGALTLALMHLGITNVVLPGFDPVGVPAAIERHRITHVFLPPTAIYMMLEHPGVRDYDYSSLRRFLYASAPMSQEKLIEAMEIFGPVMCEGYGQTEAPLAVTYIGPEEHVVGDNRLRSCGRAYPLVRLEIMNDDGEIVPRGEVGEVVLQSNLSTPGYYKQPEATAELHVDGWHHTGDVGRLDVEGYLYLVDRKKDMIISGGFNIYPIEIEQVLWAHPGVNDCTVVGAPDEKWGEAVTAVVEAKADVELDIADLERWCRDRLASIKVPKRIELWPELPRSAVGKVLKQAVRAPFWEGTNRSI